MSAQVNDRFLRLEALITSYLVESVDVPLSLQVWSEGQLRVLVPYLNGGRTPEAVAEHEVLGARLESSGSSLLDVPTGPPRRRQSTSRTLGRWNHRPIESGAHLMVHGKRPPRKRLLSSQHMTRRWRRKKGPVKPLTDWHSTNMKRLWLSAGMTGP